MRGCSTASERKLAGLMRQNGRVARARTGRLSTHPVGIGGRTTKMGAAPLTPTARRTPLP